MLNYLNSRTSELLIGDPVFMDTIIILTKEMLCVLAAHSLDLLVHAVCKIICHYD